MSIPVRATTCLALLAASLGCLSAAQTVPSEKPSDDLVAQNRGSEVLLSRAPANQALQPGEDGLTAWDLYLKVQLDPAVKLSKLKPGDSVLGTLRDDIYSGDHELYPAGSSVRLTVSQVARERRRPNDYWPWVIKAFTPRHQNRPSFQSASFIRPDKQESPLQVRLLSIGNEKEVRAKAKKSKDSNAAKVKESAKPGQREQKTEHRGPIIVLEGVRSGLEPSATDFRLTVPETIAAGTPARIILLKDVSASKSHAGDAVEARLIEPVRISSTVVLPEGSLFHGQIVKSQPPRVLSRSGSVMLKFTSLALPGGSPVPIAASIGGADLDQRSHTAIDPEGMLRGERPGMAWMLLNVGVTSGIAKEADDGTQLLVEALVSTATDASTAGMAKIASACASGIFMLTRHGRDVVLPKYTEMQIVFDRPVQLPALIAEE